MDLREYETMYRAEGRHWWYRGLRDLLFRHSGLAAPASRNWRILDAGCGTGGTLATLRRTRHRHAQGFDYNQDALHFCQERGLCNICRGSITAIPFPDDNFDLAISNDVICDTGTSNEAAALRELYRVLRPGGLLFMNLPAYPFLRSEHDQATDVDRRYTMRDLRPKVEAAGFRVVRMSHWNTLLFPLVAAIRLARKRGQDRDKKVARSDISVPPRPINDLLTAIVKAESRLIDRFTIPFGSSIIFLAEKPAAGEPL